MSAFHSCSSLSAAAGGGPPAGGGAFQSRVTPGMPRFVLRDTARAPRARRANGQSSVHSQRAAPRARAPHAAPKLNLLRLLAHLLERLRAARRREPPHSALCYRVTGRLPPAPRRAAAAAPSAAPGLSDQPATRSAAMHRAERPVLGRRQRRQSAQRHAARPCRAAVLGAKTWRRSIRGDRRRDLCSRYLGT